MAGWMFDEVAMGEEFLVCGTGVFGERVSGFFGWDCGGVLENNFPKFNVGF